MDSQITLLPPTKQRRGGGVVWIENVITCGRQERGGNADRCIIVIMQGSMDLGTDYCYAGVPLALLRLLTQGA